MNHNHTEAGWANGRLTSHADEILVSSKKGQSSDIWPHHDLFSCTCDLFCVAIIITGHEDIHLRGSVVELMCEGKDKDISRMEWISQSTDTVLASASHTNYLSLLVNTSRITRLHEVFTCIVRISNGIQLLKSVPFRIRGESYLL